MKYHWICHWMEGSRTAWGWHPFLATYDYDPETRAGAAICLMIGFSSEGECQAFITEHLESQTPDAN